MGRTPDKQQSQVLLIGAGRFASPHLDDIEAVEPGLDRLRAALTIPPTGVFSADPDRLQVLRHPTTQRQVVDAFFRAARSAEDVLFVYYAGHGLLDGTGRLHLAVAESDPLQPVGNSVDFAVLKAEMDRAKAPVRVLILDCCYSGQAVGRQSTATAAQNAAVATAQVVENIPVAAELPTDQPIAGMYVLTSSDHQSESRFVPGEKTTAFSGALLHALRPREGHDTELRDLYDRIRTELARREMPEPQSSTGNSSGGLVVQLPGDQGVEVPPSAAPQRSRRPRVIAASAAVVIAGVIGGLALVLPHDNSSSGGVTPTVQPTTVTDAATASIAPPSGLVFADDFSGATLDAEKWNPSNRPDNIRQSAGHLLISTRPGSGFDEARLYPRSLTRAFSDVRFTITIPPIAAGGQGGGAFIINPDGAAPQILTFGPSPSGASIYPLTCDKPKCRLGVYEDFTEAANTNAVRVTYDKPVDVEIERRDGRLQFSADGIPIGATAGDPGPLTGFRFNASAGPSESWDLEINKLEVR